MQRDMETSKNLTGRSIGEQLMFSAGGHHANPHQMPESERVRLMIAGSGRKQYELLERLGRGSLFSKILMTCSRWRMANHLSGYVARWKIYRTPSKRLVYLLRVSGRSTKGIEYGLWPTMTTFFTRRGWTIERINEKRELVKANTKQIGKHHSGNGFGLNIEQTLHLMKRIPNGMAPNLNWLEWYQGYPENWTFIKDSETVSTRKSRTKSLKQSKPVFDDPRRHSKADDK